MIKRTVMLRKNALIVLICLFFLQGCAGDQPVETIQLPTETAAAAAPETPEAPAPAYGGELTLSMRVPKTLNPLLNEDVTVDRILQLIFEPLVVLDENQQPTPNLAESLDFSPDGLSVDITLRDDVLWSDGAYLRADDVVFSMQVIEGASDSSVYKDAATNVNSIEAIDGKTVRVHYIEPYGGYAYRLCFPVIPKHYYAGETEPGSPVNMSPMGNGMYRWDQYVPAQNAGLIANPYSFREKAYIEKINVLVTNDVETDLYAFGENIIDAVNTNMGEWGKYRGAKEANTAEYVDSQYDFIGFNFGNPILQDIRIRQAIAHSVNVNEIIDNIYLNHAVRAYTPISPASWVFEANTLTYDFDLEKASRLIEEAGLKQNLAFTILVNEENTNRVKIANALKDNLSKIQLKAVVNEKPFEEYLRMVENQEYDLFMGGFTMSVIPDLTFAFHSDSKPASNGKNVFLYQNPYMNALLDQVNQSATTYTYKNSLSELQKFFAEDLPCVSLVFRKSALLTDKKVKGDLRPVRDNVFFNINAWYISADYSEMPLKK